MADSEIFEERCFDTREKAWMSIQARYETISPMSSVGMSERVVDLVAALIIGWPASAVRISVWRDMAVNIMDVEGWVVGRR